MHPVPKPSSSSSSSGKRARSGSRSRSRPHRREGGGEHASSPRRQQQQQQQQQAPPSLAAVRGSHNRPWLPEDDSFLQNPYQSTPSFRHTMTGAGGGGTADDPKLISNSYHGEAASRSSRKGSDPLRKSVGLAGASASADVSSSLHGTAGSTGSALPRGERKGRSSLMRSALLSGSSLEAPTVASSSATGSSAAGSNRSAGIDADTSSYARYLARQAQRGGGGQDGGGGSRRKSVESGNNQSSSPTATTTTTSTPMSAYQSMVQEKQRNEALLAKTRNLESLAESARQRRHAEGGGVAADGDGSVSSDHRGRHSTASIRSEVSGEQQQQQQQQQAATRLSKGRQQRSSVRSTTAGRSGGQQQRPRSRSASRRRGYGDSGSGNAADGGRQRQNLPPRKSSSGESSPTRRVTGSGSASSSSRRSARRRSSTGGGSVESDDDRIVAAVSDVSPSRPLFSEGRTRPSSSSPSSPGRSSSGGIRSSVLLGDGSAVEDDVVAGNSRELRSRRLRQQEQQRSTSRGRNRTSGSGRGTSPSRGSPPEDQQQQQLRQQQPHHHFKSHSPAVEQYLQRNKQQRQQQQHHQPGTRRLSDSSGHGPDNDSSAGSRLEGGRRHPQQLQQRRSSDGSSKPSSSLQQSRGGWSTVGSRPAKRDGPGGPGRSVTPDSVVGGSGMGGRKSKVDEYLASRSSGTSSAPSSGTGLSLTQRQTLAAIASSSGRADADGGGIGGAGEGGRAEAPDFDYSGYSAVPCIDDEEESSTSVSSSSLSSFDHRNFDDDDESSLDEEGAGREWSVRVCVVSAVDLPSNVVPNLPFSPVLRVGLVKLPAAEGGGNRNRHLSSLAGGATAAAGGLSDLVSRVERVGLVRAARSGGGFSQLRMRCTGSKVLAKRDAGSAEFHEEMRWDRVAQPYRMALCVELSARAVAVPANAGESPPSIKADASTPLQQLASYSPHSSVGRGGGTGSPLKASHASLSRVSSTDSADPGRSPGIGGLFRKHQHHAQRKSGSAEMETAQAAAVVAQHLVGQDSETATASNPQTAEDSTLPSAGPLSAGGPNVRSPFGGTTHPSEMDVKLRPRKRKKKRQGGGGQDGRDRQEHAKKVKFTEDIRLGSYVVPLTKLDLEKALRGKEAARIEQWFELETGASSSSPAGRPSTSPPAGSRSKRNPSVLLEISFSTPELLDDSEDDIGDDDDDDDDEFEIEDEENDSEKRDEAEGPNGGVENKEGGSGARSAPPSRGLKASFSRRASIKIRNQLKQEQKMSSGGALNALGGGAPGSPSGSSKDQEGQSPDKKSQSAKSKEEEEPVLKPGIIDYLCVVGARDIGDQKSDDGSRGWVNTCPELCVLEQFPPASESGETRHAKNGRTSVACLLDKVEWFCFPEGCRLWRGTTPPNHEELNLCRFSASSPARQAASIASFDACLSCTSSFAWFVLASNSDEYGSEQLKTFGACVRFYVPAPTGIDPTQDDFAQMVLMNGMGGGGGTNATSTEDLDGSNERQKRLWVPVGICLTSSLPIVGAMEGMLLRIVENLSTRGFHGQNGGKGKGSAPGPGLLQDLHKDLYALIVNYQRPVAGIVHCSYPFLHGERIHLTLAPRTGLPSLPHGHALNSVCRLLGADGICHMLAAALTECKILIHSADVANLCLVSEVITALIYPFTWSLPYIPVLPVDMMEFIEAPLSYLLGVPTSSMHLVPADVLEDVVVVDLDRDFGAGAAGNDFYEGQRRQTVNKGKTKVPVPLPAGAASNISKAVYKLLRAEEEVEEAFLGGLGGDPTNPGSAAATSASFFPRMEQESLVEREFRLAVAVEICGFVRGFQDCLVYAGGPNTPPVFSVDKFLQSAPALFEEQRGAGPAVASQSSQQGLAPAARRVLSPRSRRFLSLLVNCQHFHVFLEGLEMPLPSFAFFHEIMNVLEQQRIGNTTAAAGSKNASGADVGAINGLGSDPHKAVDQLSKLLQKLEDKIPTYRVQKPAFEDSGGSSNNGLADADRALLQFPRDLLQPIVVQEDDNDQGGVGQSDSGSDTGVKQISLEYLVELEKNPWRYQKLFDLALDEDSEPAKIEKIKLIDAMGERRYKAWKEAVEQERLLKDQQQQDEDDQVSVLSEDSRGGKGAAAGAAAANSQMMSLDLTSLLTSTTDDLTSVASSDCSMLSAGSDNNNNNTSGTHASSTTSARPSQRRINDAKDREILRRCLERARGPHQQAGANASTATASDPFKDSKGRDLVSEAEMALRNPSARRFLLSILNKRTAATKDGDTAAKTTSSSSNRRRPAMQSSSSTKTSRLDPMAFEVLVRLGCAMLDACMEAKDYEAAYQLLQLTVGLFTTLTETNRAGQEQVIVVYMTARIGLHPIYADLGVWERVKDIHLAARQENNRKTETGAGTEDAAGAKSSNEGSSADDVYEAAVATLYEMLGYGIPAEELARFASRVSEQNGWFRSERGQTILLLARRLCIRRDQGTGGGGSHDDTGTPGSVSATQSTVSSPSPFSPTKKSDLEIMSSSSTHPTTPTFASSRKKVASKASEASPKGVYGAVRDQDATDDWLDIGWCHPAAQSSRSRFSTTDSAAKSRLLQQRPGTQNLLNMLDEQKLASSLQSTANTGNKDHMKRSAVTSMAYLGCGVVVSGGLDGGVFLARRVALHDESDGRVVPDENSRSGEGPMVGVRGVHLDWGSSGSRYTSVGSSAGSGATSSALSNVASSSLDGEYGVGAVSCLAATKGTYHHHHAQSSLFSSSSMKTKDVVDTTFAGCMTDEELLASMEGCRVVAGTTCGDLRVWSVKDVFSAVFFSSRGGLSAEGGTPPTTQQRHYHRGEGLSSSYASGRTSRSATDYAAGSSLTRLKFSLRGRALSGHRGGVSCIDVPSAVYRPDSIVSGGADGLIKLWSLRAPAGSSTAGRRANAATSSVSAELLTPRSKAARSGDALSILSGHGGRVLCVKTAWHGDRLLSGGADRTVRVWDLATAGASSSGSSSGFGSGKCLHALQGHFGWVTAVHYWGPNTIVSASTDRAIALWDARVRKSPLFMLRHHYAPITDVLVGSRTDPVMISAASDGTVAAWDFRQLSGQQQQSVPSPSPSTPPKETMTPQPKTPAREQQQQQQQQARRCKVIRDPVAKFYLHDYSTSQQVCGPIQLAKCPAPAGGGNNGCGGSYNRTVLVLGSDAVTREWDVHTGQVLSEHVTGHCDTVSSFCALQGDKLLDTQLDSGVTSDAAAYSSGLTGTITTSWDGTIRMRTKRNYSKN